MSVERLHTLLLGELPYLMNEKTPGHYFVQFPSSPQWLVAKVDPMGDVWLVGSSEPYAVEDFLFGPPIELPPD